MITKPIVADPHWLYPETIFTRRRLNLTAGEELRDVLIIHLPTGQEYICCEIDEGDQQRWMEKMLLLFPVVQYPGRAGATSLVDKNAAIGYN